MTNMNQDELLELQENELEALRGIRHDDFVFFDALCSECCETWEEQDYLTDDRCVLSS